MYPHIDAAPEEQEVDENTEQTEFTFDELDDRAKERARNWWRAHDIDGWWDATYEDAVSIGKLIGIEIGTRPFRSMAGTTHHEPDIYFTLHVQGSGACYSGQLVVNKLKGAKARLLEYTDELQELAAQAESLYEQILVRAVTRRLLGENPAPSSADWYIHDEIGGCDVLTIEGRERYYTSRLSDDNQFPDALVAAVNDFTEAFASWIHDQLDDESMRRYSAEYVDENIRGNDCLFDAFGSII
jgi:hypothetical protein